MAIDAGTRLSPIQSFNDASQGTLGTSLKERREKIAAQQAEAAKLRGDDGKSRLDPFIDAAGSQDENGRNVDIRA